MRTVRAGDGTVYLLRKESSESSLVEHPETGDRRHLPNDELEPVDGESPLTTASRAVPDPVRAVVTATHDERALGLLLEIEERGPVDVRSLTEAYDLCESDLHGLLAEFRAAGLVRATDVTGVRGYESTERASAGLEALVAAR